MAATSELTAWLAIAFGLYSLAAGLGGLLSPARWRGIFGSLDESPALAFLAGIVTFAIGWTIVLVHPWGNDLLSALVTLIGWGMIAEGILFFAFPAAITAFARLIIGGDRMIRLWAGLSVAIGLFLVFVGYVRLNVIL